MRTPSTIVPTLLLSAAALGVAACSGSASLSIGGESPTSAAGDLIEGDLAYQLGITMTDIDCETPSDPEVGTTFACTSDSEFGTIDWLVEIDREDHINVDSINLIRADALPKLEAAAADQLSQSVGETLPADNFDCGDEPIVLGETATIDCILTIPADPSITYDATLIITDLEAGEFDIEVADEPN